VEPALKLQLQLQWCVKLLYPLFLAGSPSLAAPPPCPHLHAAALLASVLCTDVHAAEGLQDLQARINEMRDAQGPATAAAGSSSSWSREQPLAGRGTAAAGDDADSLDATGSFSDAEDSEVSAALNRRISQIATTTGEWGSSMDEEEMGQPLTGEVSFTLAGWLLPETSRQRWVTAAQCSAHQGTCGGIVAGWRAAAGD
jgi:hypothetical protein